MAELDNLKQQFAEYEELLVDLQGENEELKSGGGGGGGDGGELKKQLEEEKKKNKALQEVGRKDCVYRKAYGLFSSFRVHFDYNQMCFFF